jgi:hypothetical protein
MYRLAMEEDNGRINYSSILRVTWNNEKAVSVYPTVVSNGVLNLSFSIPANQLQVVNSNGAIVFEKQLNNLSGAAAINLPSLPKGMYVIKIRAGHEAFTNKIIVN